jgi:hypothetical protein
LQLSQSKSAVLAEFAGKTQRTITVLRSPASAWPLPALISASVPAISTAPHRGRAPSIGILLYLVSVALVAGATIGVFFGVAFSLVRQPANALTAERPVRGHGSTVVSVPQDGSPRGSGVILSGTKTMPATAKTARPLGPGVAPAITIPAQKAAARAPSDAGAKISAALHLPERQVAALIARGDVFLRAGDIASARLFYERAAEAGDGQAALKLGATFDPNFFTNVALRAMIGDPAKALFWYHRALGLGASQAEPRLSRLETK